MMKRTTLIFAALLGSFASFAQIVGTFTVCTGATTTLADSASGGGTWVSGNPAVASIASSSPFHAIINGVSAGTAAISYVHSTGVDVQVVSVNPSPAVIVGPSRVCVGSTATFTCATPGGTWSSSTPALSMGATTGIGMGMYASMSNWVEYTLPTGCVSRKPDTVVNGTSDSLWGGSTVCIGGVMSLSTTIGGGTWTSSDPTIATVYGSTGFLAAVNGISAGTVTITHTSSTSCGLVSDTHVVTVTSGTAGTLSGPATLAIGGSSMLSSTVPGGTWTSSNPSVATITSGGYVTGVAAGTVTMTYTSPCSSGATATHVMTIAAPSGISGHVHFPGAGWASVKVWLIKYNPSTMMLSAIDSDYVNGLDSAYYEFLGIPTDSYRVKADLDSASFMGFVPTYHTSSFYWNTASVIHHTSGAWDANKDINLITGTSTSGPGFIGGSVLTGANKGTADGAPAVGLGIYLVNSTTGAVVKYTTTDASGSYSFSGVALGTYKVFPEALSYVTLPYNGITLTSSAASMTTAKFRQRTISKIIQPITAGVDDLSGANTAIVAFPNPTNGKLNISWDAPTTDAATVVITDVTGREVLAKDFSMTKGNGAQVVDLSSFANGMYFVSVRSASTMYVSKIEVRH